MNLLEAMQAVLNGERVRRKNWDESRYIKLDADSKRLVDEKERFTNMVHPVAGAGAIEAMLGEEWEIYNVGDTLTFKGKILDITRYCECHNCTGCLISPMCEFSQHSDLIMADFLMDVEDYNDLDEKKIDAMYRVINC